MTPMYRVLTGLSIVASLTAALAGDNDKRFSPAPATSYPTKQAQGRVTVAAVPYVNDDEIRTAFGKSNPYKNGVLPVLVVIQNDSSQALRLDLKAEYIDARERHIDAISPRDILAAGPGPRRPSLGGGSPIPLPKRKKKNPLAEWEIEGLAFSARMVPPGESVHGFFYFQSRLEPASRLYLTGLSEAKTGKELFYFEIPLTQ
jgi:hypothetical protein